PGVYSIGYNLGLGEAPQAFLDINAKNSATSGTGIRIRSDHQINGLEYSASYNNASDQLIGLKSFPTGSASSADIRAVDATLVASGANTQGYGLFVNYSTDNDLQTNTITGADISVKPSESSDVAYGIRLKDNAATTGTWYGIYFDATGSPTNAFSIYSTASSPPFLFKSPLTIDYASTDTALSIINLSQQSTLSAYVHSSGLGLEILSDSTDAFKATSPAANYSYHGIGGGIKLENDGDFIYLNPALSLNPFEIDINSQTIASIDSSGKLTVLDIDATKLNKNLTWADDTPIALTWTFDVSGATNPSMSVGGGGFNFSTGLQRDGADVVDVNRSLTGGFGININSSDAAQNLSSDLTIDFDPAEIQGTTTWGQGINIQDEWVFDISDGGAGDPQMQVGGGGFNFTKGLLVDGVAVETETHASEHESGGNDEINVAGLLGVLNDPQKVNVNSNDTPISTQNTLNFHDGTAISWTITDDPTFSQANLTANFDGTKVSDITWADNVPILMTWTFDVSGATNPTMSVGGGGFNFSTGLQRDGVDVVDVNRSLTGGLGIKINSSDAAQNLSADRTIDFDPTEIEGTTWFGGGALQNNWTFDVSGTTDPQMQIGVGGFNFTVGLQVDGQAVETDTHASEHENGGADEINVQDLSGLLADPQKVNVNSNDTPISTRNTLNIHDGTGINWTITDDATFAQANLTANFVSTKLSNLTWADNTPILMTWTFDVSGTTNPTMSVGGGGFNFSTGLQIDGQNVETDTHAAEHENGGADEIDTSDLAGHVIVKATNEYDLTLSSSGTEWLMTAPANLTITRIEIFYTDFVSPLGSDTFTINVGRANSSGLSSTYFKTVTISGSKNQYTNDVYTTFTNTTLNQDEALYFNFTKNGSYDSGKFFVSIAFKTQ
ncbi:hypothetical protein D6827_00690, partial [Candidatus Parcubacteria bacterium]